MLFMEIFIDQIDKWRQQNTAGQCGEENLGHTQRRQQAEHRGMQQAVDTDTGDQQ